MVPGPGNGILGIGDDCAIIPGRTGTDTLVSTDMLVEEVHFLRREIPPRLLGWKSAAVNLSDIAAMGAVPTGTFLSLALPSDIDKEWTDEFIAGYSEISRLYGVPLLGGDTTSSPQRICINVAVLGECPAGSAKRRSGAVAGDKICVTGTLGDSAAGLEVILHGWHGTEAVVALVERHFKPEPRIKEGLALRAERGVHAMMDISDGIGSDLRHIMKASGTGAKVDVHSLPLSEELLALCREHNELDPVRLACSGGEDYELLFTADPSCEAKLEVPHTVIGEITEGNVLEWCGTGNDYLGFRHF